VPDLAVGPGLTIPFAESRLPHFVCRPSLVPVVVCRPRLLPAAAPITWPRPDLPLGSALNSPPTATRGNHPPRPLHQPPPTILLAPLLPSQRRGPPRRRLVPSPVESCPSCCRCLLSPSLSPSAPHPANRCRLRRRRCRRRYRSRPTPTFDYRHRPRRRRRRRRCRCRRRPRTPVLPLFSPPPKSHRLSRHHPLPLATRYRSPLHAAVEAAPYSSPRTPPRSPPLFAAMLTPHPAEPRPLPESPPPARPNQPPVHAEPRRTHHPADPLARHPPLLSDSPDDLLPPLRSPDVAHRSRQSPPRLSSPPRPSPVHRQSPSPELAHATPRRRRLQSSSPRRASAPPPLVRSPRVPSTINNLVVPPSPSLPLHPSPSPAPRLCLNHPPRDYPLELQLP